MNETYSKNNRNPANSCRIHTCRVPHIVHDRNIDSDKKLVPTTSLPMQSKTPSSFRKCWLKRALNEMSRKSILKFYAPLVISLHMTKEPMSMSLSVAIVDCVIAIPPSATASRATLEVIARCRTFSPCRTQTNKRHYRRRILARNNCTHKLMIRHMWTLRYIGPLD